VDWLKHGSGAFHFAGKPGSGKSTLFKFLANDYRVLQSLKEWASSANKQLILSKFFFWGLGSNDQKNVPGLLRGLLFEICIGNSSITRLIFHRLWGKKGLERETTIKDDDIRTAFDQMLCNQEIHRDFRFCFFIDGLDEFNGTEMTHWKLARMLLDWTQQPAETTTADNFLKLCVSSREDNSIMTVFRNSFQIRLQDITKRDVSAVVEDSLFSNEYFNQLQKKDPAGCQELINSILQGADGVFLWVSLLLNLLEEELPSASSVAALQSIVRTTPIQLEDFIAKILDTIRKHHRRGAYFVLAMALRMMGLHLSAIGTFPAAEQHEYQEIFGAERYWRPVLHSYGLSAVFQTLEMGNPSENYGDVLASLVDDEHSIRCQDAAVKIRTWCRGLLEVFTVDQNDIMDAFDQDLQDANSESLTVSSDGKSKSWSDSGPKFAFVKFTHRSIPDFLMSVIQDKAAEYTFNIQCSEKQTCLHSVICKRIPQVHILYLIGLAGKKTLCVQDNQGNTPLHYAVKYEFCSEEQIKIVKALVAKSDAGMDIVNSKGLSPYRFHEETHTEAINQAKKAQDIALQRGGGGKEPDRGGGSSQGKPEGSVMDGLGNQDRPDHRQYRPHPPPSTHGFRMVQRVNTMSNAPPGKYGVGASKAAAAQVVDLPKNKSTIGINEDPGAVGKDRAKRPSAGLKNRKPSKGQTKTKKDSKEYTKPSLDAANAIKNFLKLHYLRTRKHDEAVEFLYGPSQGMSPIQPAPAFFRISKHV